ncbi:Predicted Zn-dependent protease TldD [Alteracholeplasma palmae J233]|uniref:Predicted Zn-dependent protease TldD n=1 Tax=Alteracholeplasma palmae (strain ATCC 49389 / J233) TaxID=1318466 RepID=U4KKK6_ALTPJ|nr:TldD/PmbA family protein [Alteracholeplasma palmae]CCV64133.1 Predicted Zn-dependent protease TldD [Alteracholeplasma palmae J233]
MLTKIELQEILNQALTTGADFAEIFIEDSKNQSIAVIGKEITGASSSDIHGVGVRIILGIDEVYGFTNKVTYQSVLDLANNLKASFNGKTRKAIPLGEKKPFKYTIKKPMRSIPKETKALKLVSLSKIMQDASEKITQTVVRLIEKEQKVLIANTNGIYQDDIRTYTRCTMMAVAKDQDKMQEAFEGPGRHMGYELFDVIDFDTIAKETALKAVALLDAKDMVPQVLPVVIHNGFGGVIFHEACGHPLEATAIAKGLSPFVGKIGEKVASSIVTAYDDGTIEDAWGSLNFDDEGKATQKNLLIENGILKGYLVDYRNGKKMNAESTGSARRQSYKYSPTSRMNSTYIAPGKDTLEEIIKDTKYGLFAKSLGGGTVQPATGEFNFVVTEGYMIEDGKLTTPVKGAMLIGQGGEILHKIDKVANNLELGQGMCGSISGSIPVDVGQPTIRVSEMTVGGSGGKN